MNEFQAAARTRRRPSGGKASVYGSNYLVNVVVSCNSVNSLIFFGKSGEVASKLLEEQELSALTP